MAAYIKNVDGHSLAWLAGNYLSLEGKSPKDTIHSWLQPAVRNMGLTYYTLQKTACRALLMIIPEVWYDGIVSISRTLVAYVSAYW